MKRNPIEYKMKNYYDSINFKKIKPRFFYQKCNKCGNEFKNEIMFRCTYNDDWLDFVTNNYYGCSECFKNLNHFEKFCRENVLVHKEDWIYNGEFHNPFINKLINYL